MADHKKTQSMFAADAPLQSKLNELEPMKRPQNAEDLRSLISPCSLVLAATLLLSLSGTTALAQPPHPVEPTEEQLQAAIKEFEALKGQFRK